MYQALRYLLKWEVVLKLHSLIWWMFVSEWGGCWGTDVGSTTVNLYAYFRSNLKSTRLNSSCLFNTSRVIPFRIETQVMAFSCLLCVIKTRPNICWISYPSFKTWRALILAQHWLVGTDLWICPNSNIKAQNLQLWTCEVDPSHHHGLTFAWLRQQTCQIEITVIHFNLPLMSPIKTAPTSIEEYQNQYLLWKLE